MNQMAPKKRKREAIRRKVDSDYSLSQGSVIFVTQQRRGGSFTRVPRVKVWPASETKSRTVERKSTQRWRIKEFCAYLLYLGERLQNNL